MEQPKFVIEASEAKAMAQSLGLESVLQLLPTLVQPAQSLARAPISKFNVAAVGLGSDGRIFIGVNVEFPGLPLHHSIHAEQFLLTNLSIHNCPSLIAFAVSAAPCGHCRQFLQELRHSNSLKICITHDQNLPKSPSFKTLVEFLPSPFGPLHLLDDQTPLFLEVKDNGLKKSALLSNGYADQESKISDFCEDYENLSNGYHPKTEKNEEFLVDEALKAANNSHAPYSGSPSGVALRDCDGNVYRGSYAESAAYNPSLGPVQAALVAFIAGGGGGYESIVAAAFVEKKGAIVLQEDTTKIILKKVAPKADLRVVHCFHGENGN